jgi:hypothetical protein
MLIIKIFLAAANHEYIEQSCIIKIVKYVLIVNVSN